jgi:hypothetical protein
LEGLAAGLAALLGESTPPARVNPVDHFKHAAAELLNRLPPPGRRCLLVLDGLDEATGFEVDTGLLPAIPNAGLRIVLSARLMALSDANGWCDRIGWTLDGAAVRKVSVPPLDIQGIERLLIANKVHLAEEKGSGIAASLMLLTKGEPLLLRFYAQDLADLAAKGHEVTAASLAKLQPGYHAYFKRWFKNQEDAWRDAGRQLDERWKVVLAVLATAFGPVLHRDLEALTAQVLARDVVIDVDVIGLVERFIINDGLTAGFVLAHPHLADYVKNVFLAHAWIPRARSAFRAWGERVLAELANERLPPEEAPSYLLQFYRQHLQEQSAPLSDYMTLMNLGWMRGWRAFEGGYLGFSQDIKSAMDEIRRRAAPHPQRSAWLLQGALLLNSLQYASATPPELLVACVHRSVLSLRQALARLELMGTEPRTLGLIGILPFMPEGDQHAWFNAALGMARGLKSRNDRIRAFVGVTKAIESPQQRQELQDEILGILEQIQYGPDCLDGISDAASVLIDTRRERLIDAVLSKFDDRDIWWHQWSLFLASLPEELCIAIAEKIPGLRGSALPIFFPYLAREVQAKQWQRALAEARNCKDPWARLFALTSVYPLVPLAEQSPLMNEILELADEMDGTRNGCIYGHVRAAAVLPYPQAGQALEHAVSLAIADLPTDNFSRLEPIAPVVSGELLDRCFSAAVSASRAAARAKALGQLAPKLSVPQLEQALAALGRVGDEPFIAIARIALSAQLKLQEQDFGLKLSVAPTWEWGLTAETALLRALPPDLWPKVVPSYAAMLDNPSNSDELFSLAADLPAELIPRVFASALGDGERRQVRPWALLGVAHKLTESEAVVAFEATCRLAKEDRPNARAPLMAALLDRLPKDLRPKAIRQVLRELATAPHGSGYSKAVAGVAPHVSPGVRPRLLNRAFERARADKYPSAYVYAPLLRTVGLEEQKSVVREALDKEAQHRSFFGPKERADALAWLLLAADTPIQMELFSAWTSALLQITEDDERLSRVVRLLPKLKDDFRITILQLMPDLIKHAARPIVLLATAGLAPTISRVSGEEGLRALLAGVRTVATEFP